MHDPNDRYRRGVELMQQAGCIGIEAISNKVAEIAPDFARMMIEFPFGDLYARPVVDLKTREIVAISVLTALGTALPQLRVHVSGALHVGWRREDVVEILMQTACYAGFPAAINALAGCHDLLTDGECACLQCRAPAEGQL